MKKWVYVFLALGGGSSFKIIFPLYPHFPRTLCRMTPGLQDLVDAQGSD